MNLYNEILSDITVFNKYAKYLPQKFRRENWVELVTRNMEMHIRSHPALEQEIRDAYVYVFKKQVLPSMRSLQFGGLPIELAHNRIYNCAYVPIDDKDAFSELMFLLLGGTGGGYSVQRRHTDQLPKVKGPQKETRRFVVGDSIEGWADAVKVLVESYFLGKHKVNFDVRDIRPKGAELITTGGKAPGPEPLARCLAKLEEILQANIGKQLAPIEVHDMVCTIANAVLAGGIRRAALICLFDKDDNDMLECKSNYSVTATPTFMSNLYEFTIKGRQYTKVIKPPQDFAPEDMWQCLVQDDVLNPYGTLELQADGSLKGTVPWFFIEEQRGRANNSAALLRGEVTQEEFMSIMEKVEASGAGEPGVYWTSNLDWGTNPCCEIALRPYQFCNLCEVNADDVESQEDLNNRAKAAAFIGTLQASYTDFHYLRPCWRETTEKDALIGVGMTGIGSGKVLDLSVRIAAHEVVKENARVAKLLGINSAARTTTIKPSGTSSLVLGCSSGIHAWHNDYYIRRQRVGFDEALYTYMKEHFPELVEDDATNSTQAIISFPQKAPEGSILRHESALELLERVRHFNIEWVRAGHNDGDNTHNVSCTISVKPHEWPEVSNWMWENRNDYNGIAVLPYSGGTYLQAPFEDITEDAFDNLVGMLTSIDLTQVVETVDNTDHKQEAACAGAACDVSL